MRGTPHSRLRQSVAHALRRALVGTLALASIAIAIPVATALTAQSTSEVPGTAAAVASESSLTSLLQPDDDSDRVTVQIQPDPIELVAPVTPPSDATAPTRSVRAAASQRLAGPPPVEPAEAAPPVTASLQTRQLLAAGPPLINRAEEALEVAEPDPAADLPVIVEPPFSTTLGHHPGSPPLAAGDFIEATISFYYCEQGDTASGGDGGGFCGAMRDGTIVYEGAAACGLTYLGQQFRIVGDPTGRTYTCHDTGNAVLDLHRDIFFHQASDGWPWLWSVGTTAVLEIVR